MPRRNLLTVLLVGLLAALCYQRVEHNPYGRYLTHVLDEIDKRALEQVPRQELFDGAMRGIVTQLNQRIDQHSAYISAKDEREFRAELEQQFGGVGVMIKLEGEEEEGAKRVLRVTADPLVDTPAHKAGIRAGDKITAINGESTADMTMKQVMSTMRGEVGTAIELTIAREGVREPILYTLRRAVISVPSVYGDRPLKGGSWEYRLQQDPRIGYLRIVNFGEKTIAEMKHALITLEEQGAEAVILDLRDNAGGLLDTAVEACQLFLRRGQAIVSVKRRGGVLDQQYKASSHGPYRDLPLAVLVNDHSASASEIVAACLQDNDRAIVAGTRTYGKGTVQQVIRIESGRSILKLTSASYWRPNNKNIHRHATATDDDDWGVVPDTGLEVPLTEEDAKRWREERSQRDSLRTNGDVEPGAEENPPSLFDPQLDRAVEELQRRLERRAAQPQAA